MTEQADPTSGSGRSGMLPRGARGRCGFRMMPSDDLVDAFSEALLVPVGIEASAVHYTWHHPDDGMQYGVVLVGAADPATGRVEGSLYDTWHHHPGLMPLRGTREGDAIQLSGNYLEEWGWEVEVTVSEEGPAMTMRNVVPESALDQMQPDAPRMSPGPYDVMVGRWRWDAGPA